MWGRYSGTATAPRKAKDTEGKTLLYFPINQGPISLTLQGLSFLVYKMGMTVQGRKAVIQYCWWRLQRKLFPQKRTMEMDRYTPKEARFVAPLCGGKLGWLVQIGRKGVRVAGPSPVPTEPDPLAFSEWDRSPQSSCRERVVPSLAETSHGFIKLPNNRLAVCLWGLGLSLSL